MESNKLMNGTLERKKVIAKKTSKVKKDPIKVVYISNPMKVKASAAEFRALVQELTGQDSELPPDYSHISGDGKYVSGAFVHADNQSEYSAGCLMNQEHNSEVDEAAQKQQTAGGGSSCAKRFQELEEVYTPQMIDNFPDASVFYNEYDAAQMDHALRRFGTL